MKRGSSPLLLQPSAAGGTRFCPGSVSCAVKPMVRAKHLAGSGFSEDMGEADLGLQGQLPSYSTGQVLKHPAGKACVSSAIDV